MVLAPPASPPNGDDFRTHSPTDPIDDTPTVPCSRCDEGWDLSYKFDGLRLGNQSAEQFAFDYHHRTEHFPNDASPWIASCRQYPDDEQFLSEASAHWWICMYARHTRREVSVDRTDEDSVVITPG